jgi:hypothetical protein
MMSGSPSVSLIPSSRRGGRPRAAEHSLNECTSARDWSISPNTRHRQGTGRTTTPVPGSPARATVPFQPPGRPPKLPVTAGTGQTGPSQRDPQISTSWPRPGALDHLPSRPRQDRRCRPSLPGSRPPYRTPQRPDLERPRYRPAGAGTRAKPTGAFQRYGLAHFHPGHIPQRLPETRSGG